MIEKHHGRPASSEGRSDVEVRTYDFLDSLGVDYNTVCHEGAYTMEECAAVERELGAPVCKNLFLCNRQHTQFYLLMLPGGKKFKTKWLSSQLGCARLSFAEEEYMVSMLGIHPGAVSPIGLVNDSCHKVLLVIDRDLFASATFGCHPCVNTSTLSLRLQDLTERIVPATGHEYRVVELKGEE